MSARVHAVAERAPLAVDALPVPYGVGVAVEGIDRRPILCSGVARTILGVRREGGDTGRDEREGDERRGQSGHAQDLACVENGIIEHTRCGPGQRWKMRYGSRGRPSHQRRSGVSSKTAKCRWGVLGGALPVVPT